MREYLKCGIVKDLKFGITEYSKYGNLEDYLDIWLKEKIQVWHCRRFEYKLHIWQWNEALTHLKQKSEK
jgi:hypothetical protein